VLIPFSCLVRESYAVSNLSESGFHVEVAYCCTYCYWSYYFFDLLKLEMQKIKLLGQIIICFNQFQIFLWVRVRCWSLLIVVFRLLILLFFSPWKLKAKDGVGYKFPLKCFMVIYEECIPLKYFGIDFEVTRLQEKVFIVE